MDYIVHGILQARILEWGAFPFSRGSSQPRNRTRVSCTAGGFFTSWRRKWQPTPVFLPRKFPMDGLQSMGSQRVGHDWVTSLSIWEAPLQCKFGAKRRSWVEASRWFEMAFWSVLLVCCVCVCGFFPCFCLLGFFSNIYHSPGMCSFLLLYFPSEWLM